MLRQDLIKRAIEQLAAALARAMGYRASGQDLQALECLNEAKGSLPLVPSLALNRRPAIAASRGA